MKNRPLGTFCVLVIVIQILIGISGRSEHDIPDTGNLGRITAVGQVYEKSIRQDYQILYLQNAEVSASDQKIKKRKNIVYDKEFQKVRLGNAVFVTGEGSSFDAPRNPGNFDQKFYYEKQGIFMKVFAERVKVVRKDVWKIRDGLFELRGRWHKMLLRVLGEKDGGTFSAIMMGEKADLDERRKEMYQANGISHLLAISGLHLSLVGLVFYEGLRRLGLSYKVAGMIGGSGLFLYAIMTGMSVSATRATVMFLLRIGADMCGRVYDMMTALLLTGTMILWEKPLYVFDPGFLLSFGAIMGILLLLPTLKLLLPCKRRWIEGAYAGVAIQGFLFPITLYFFFEIPVYSALLNLLVIPLMPLLLGGGLVGSAIYGLFPWVGTRILLGSSLILKGYDFVCKWGIRLPGSRLTVGQPKWQQVVVCYLLLLLFILYVRRKSENGEKELTKLGRCGGVFALCVILLISVPWKHEKNELEVTMLDVGQGDGIYMRGPSGMHYFVDGGSSDVKKVGKYRIESFLKSRGVGTLDYVFLSHGDGDHIGGIRELLERQDVGIRIRTLVLPVENVWDDALKEIGEIALFYGTQVVVMEAGEELSEGEFRIRCLQPGNEFTEESGNGASMVLQVEYKDFDMLLTGDVEGKGEELLVFGGALESVDVLKVAHHGSKNSTKDDFLDLVRPKIALISAGRENSYGHPHMETIKRLKKAGIIIYNTQESGAVTIRTDGRRMHVEVVAEKGRFVYT